MKTSQTMKVGIIDSGVDTGHKKLASCKLAGMSVEFADDEISCSDDFNDTMGHGTACAGIIHKHNPDAELFIVKILSDSGKAHEKQLCHAIKVCVENKVDIINISMGVQTSAPGRELVDICATAHASGIIIVAAANNDFCQESYPAHFPATFGVMGGRGKSHEYGYRPAIDYFVAKGDIQRVAWKDGRSNITGGTSFACAHFTGIVSSVVSRRNVKSIAELKSFLAGTADKEIRPMQDTPNLKKAPYIQREDLDRIGREVFTSKKNDWIKNIALFPVSEKEMNTFQEFPDYCKYNIAARLDYPRNIKGDGNVSAICCDEWGGIDTLVLGYFADHQFEANVRHGYDIIREAISLNKNFFVFDGTLRDKLNKTVSGSGYEGVVYTPGVDNAVYEKVLRFKYLPEVSVPVIAVIGTSNKQGKFTTQLCVKSILEEEGYKVSHIATEPHGELFGAESSFPYGHKGTVGIPRLCWMEFLRTLAKGVEHYNKPDLIITGTQSSFIPRTFTHLGDTTTSLDYVFGIQPDAFVCAINPQDTMEQIRDVFDAMRIFTKAKPLFCVMTSHERSFIKGEEDVYAFNRELSGDEYIDKMSYFKENLDMEVFNIWDESNYGSILKIIEDAF